MASRKFIEVTLDNYSILHGYDRQNQEIKEYKEATVPQKIIIATYTLLAVDEKYIITTHIINRICFGEYSNGFEEFQDKLCRKTVNSY